MNLEYLLNKNSIQMTMSQTIGKVLVGNQASRVIQVRSGVRQGDALSAVLFSLALHSAIKKVEPSGTIVSHMPTLP
jgi:urease beta subunit